jgi:hypothetical protein
MLSEVKQEHALNLSISLSAGKNKKITMITSVTASEAVRAQDENREPPALRIVIYRANADQLPEAQVSWNRPPERMKAPYGVGKTLGVA